MKKELLFLFFCVLLLSACSDRKEHMPKNIKYSPVRLEPFNNVNKVIDLLSKNGIGRLRDWSSPFDYGFGSSTDYYSFGSANKVGGLKNNLCYYIDGTSTNVKTLLLVLNINNPKEKSKAVQKFIDVSLKTFKSLNIEAPKNYVSQVKKGKISIFENNDYKLSTFVEKTNIESYKLKIQTK